MRNTRLVRKILLIGLVLVMLIGAVKITRISMAGWSAYQSARQLRTYLAAENPLDQAQAMQRDVAAINDAVATVNRELGPLAPLLRRVQFAPIIGPTVAAVPQLSDGGAQLTELSEQALSIIAPALAQTEGDMVTRLIDTLDATGEELAELAPLAQNAAEELATVDAAGLHPAIAGEFALAQEALPVLPAVLRLSPELPALLGFDGPRTYLLLVQNNHELRATGGFITAVARVTLEEGKITDLDVVDSYRIFNRASTYPPAPEPMQRFMNIPLMLLRDANWSPDLPTTVTLIEALYQQDTRRKIDGVVTVDLHALELLVEGLGSVRVEGVDEPVTRDNVLELIKTFWQNPDGEGGVSGGSTAESREEFNEWWGQRKDFMPEFAGAVLQRVQAGNLDLVAIVEAGLAALNERAVQAVVNDPEAAQALADLGWDGGIAPVADADYLALIDTNMGYNKVDSVLERSLDYAVDWQPDGTGTATATLTYRHPLEADDHECDLTPRYGETYDDMAARCYFDYVRLYVPRGSTLVEATGVQADSISSRPGENGTEVFTGYFVLKPGEEQTVTFEYRLPETITPNTYSLVMQRQAGAKPLPVSITVGDALFDATLRDGRLEWTPSAATDAGVKPAAP